MARPTIRGWGAGCVTLTGGRVTRHTLIYIVGLLAVAPFSLVSVAVLTRLLLPAQYGELGVLFVFAGFATVFYNTGSLHGTFMLVYGASEGEGDDVGSDTEITSAPRRALGTGVVLTLMIVTAGTAVCFVLAPRALAGAAAPPRPEALARALGRGLGGGRVAVAADCERLQDGAPAGSLRALQRDQAAVRGRRRGAAGGARLRHRGRARRNRARDARARRRCASRWRRRSYAFAFCLADVKKIVRLGSMVVVPVLCLYVVHSSDIVLLSRFATAHELGVYRVASRFAVIPSYFASALLMTWAPLEHGVLFRATYKHVGEKRVRGAMLSYYLLISMTIVVLLDVFANVLVLLAGPEYRAAAPADPADRRGVRRATASTSCSCGRSG